jgi:hypothetical protein
MSQENVHFLIETIGAVAITGIFGWLAFKMMSGIR